MCNLPLFRKQTCSGTHRLSPFGYSVARVRCAIEGGEGKVEQVAKNCAGVCVKLFRLAIYCTNPRLHTGSHYILGYQDIIPTLGSEGPQWGPVDLIYPSMCLSVFEVVHVAFWWTFVRPIIVRSTCSRRPWVQIF